LGISVNQIVDDIRIACPWIPEVLICAGLFLDLAWIAFLASTFWNLVR